MDYSYAAFGEHAEAILDHFGLGKLRWLGTSMGGLIGVTVAAGRLKGRITHLAVNDIGPSVPQEAAARIASYVGDVPFFSTMSELEGWFRKNYAPFGENTDAFWRRMADTSSRRADDGRVTVHYDPRIVTQFTLHKSDLDCWPQWDALGETLTGKALLLRGENSDVLPKAVADVTLQIIELARSINLLGFFLAVTGFGISVALGPLLLAARLAGRNLAVLGAATSAVLLKLLTFYWMISAGMTNVSNLAAISSAALVLLNVMLLRSLWSLRN